MRHQRCGHLVFATCAPSLALLCLNPANRAAIVRLCTLLSGMPLGIELAAAWMRTLTPEEIATEIGRSLDFLTLADRGVPARHRSLRAAFEHSWKLLAPAEQKAAAHLSIFRGGFRREGAQAVAGATLPILAALIDKSLVQVLPESAEAETHKRLKKGPDAKSGLRYEIHELLRQYLRDKLVEMGEKTAARRHIDYFTAMAETWKRITMPRCPCVVQTIARRTRQFARGTRMGVERAPCARDGFAIGGCDGAFLVYGRCVEEGREWLRTALAVADENTPPQVRAMVLTQLGDLEHSMAEYAARQEPMKRHWSSGAPLMTNPVSPGRSFRWLSCTLRLPSFQKQRSSLMKVLPSIVAWMNPGLWRWS